MNGSTFHYCTCRGADGRQLGKSCPQLPNSRHRKWGYVCRVKTTTAEAWQLRRKAFPSKGAAEAELGRIEELLKLADGDDRVRASIGDMIRDRTLRSSGGQLPTADDVKRRLGSGVRLDQAETTAEYLEEWLASKRRLRPSTRRSYTAHIRNVWIPLLGDVPVERLRRQRVNAAVSEIFARSAVEAERDARARAKAARQDPPSVVPGKPVTPVRPPTVQRMLATLRAAMDPLEKEGRLASNPAKKVELPEYTQPKVRPWTATEAGAFLDASQSERLLALYELTMLEGLRRGEVIGVRWADVDLVQGLLEVTVNRVDVGGRVVEGRPKTKSGERRIAIGARSVGVLEGWRLRQQLEREEWGAGWTDSGYVFTREDGHPLRPEYVSHLFAAMCARADVRRIRFHDLRHTSASLSLAAGVDRVVVSKRLGHSSTTITNDIYSHLYDTLGRDASDAAAALIPRGPIPGSSTPE